MEILGHINDPGVDILSIVRAYGLPEEFPEDVMEEVSHAPEELSAEEIKDWNQSDVYNGQRLRLIEGERIVSEGQNVGIDKKGRILLQDGNQTKAFCIGEASLRP